MRLKYKMKMKRQKTIGNFSMVSVLLMVLLVGGVFAQSFGAVEDKVDSGDKASEGSSVESVDSDSKPSGSASPFSITAKVVDSSSISSTDYSVEGGSEAGNSYGEGSEAENSDERHSYGLPDMYVKVKIDPSRQVTDNGEAVYTITVKDLHKPCAISDEMACVTALYHYNLEFISGLNVNGELEKTEVNLGAGESETIELRVSTDKKGASNFAVYVEGSNTKAKANGVLVYLSEIDPIPSAGFFNGKGYLINGDESKGYLVDLTILNKDGTLSGKVKIGERVFKIDGDFLADIPENSGQTISFDLINIRTGNVVANFFGNVKSFANFKVLEGEVTYLSSTDELNEFSAGVWKLTAFGKNRFVISGTTQSSGGPVDVSIDAVLVVEESSDIEDDSVYVRPIKIERKKILGFLPWGKKVMKIEIIRGDEITNGEIAENSETQVEGYVVSVGSLENQDSIQVRVEKAA